MITEYKCKYLFTTGHCFEENVVELLRQARYQTKITKLVFFGSPLNNGQYCEQLQLITQETEAAFGDNYPLLSYVAQPLACGASLAVEVHSVIVTNDTIEYKSWEGERYIVIKNSNEKILMTGALRDSTLNDCIRKQSDTAFNKAEKILHAEGLDINNIIRQWNYIEQITDIRNGVQCYQAFNDSRSLFYRKTEWTNGYPAATGIGTQWGGVIIDLIAGKGNPQTFKVIPIDNPLQVAAHAYSQSVLLGEKDERVKQRTTPKFERAKIQSANGIPLCFVSGTAAIRGEESLENVGIEQQTQITLENIEYLVSEKNCVLHGYSLSKKLEANSMRIYLKRASDYPVVRLLMDNHYPNLEKLYVQANVCREELLIEIEAIYNITT